MQYRYLLLPLLACGASSQALAQDAGSLLRDREQQQELPALKQLPEEEATPPAPPPSVEPKAAETLLVKTLRFSGKSSLLSEAQRAQLAARIEGKQAAFADIRSLADAANTALRQNGYLLARAIIPPQDATEGVLTIEIVEGKLEEISFNYDEGVRIRRGLLERIVDRQVDRDSLAKDDLESALLRMDDLPGVTARSRLAPGETAGTSRVVIDVTEEPVFSGSVYGDNYGSPSTGRAQAHVQAILTDVTGGGDLTRLGLSFSEGQRYASASIAAPLTSGGLTATINYGFLSYENIDAIGQAAGLEGHAHFGTVGLAYQAIRTRNHNLRLSAALNGKALTDESSAGRLADKRIVSGTLGFSGDVRDTFLGSGVTQFAASWTFGDLDLSRLPSAEFNDALGLRTQGSFHRLNADLVRLQKLPGAFSLLARASSQWASKNLDSSESFSLGGPYGVRGWPVGEGRGDMGLLGTMELRYDVPTAPDWGSVQLSTFLDGGKVWLNKRSYGISFVNACVCNDYALWSAGLGLMWRRDNLNLAASWAHGLGDNPGRSAIGGANADGSTRRHQFWLSGSIRF